MRLMTVELDGRRTLAVERADGGIVDLAQDPALPAEMVDLVALRSLPATPGTRVEELLASGTVTEAAVRLLAPIRPRNNIMCVGKNYRAHAAEFAGSGFDASAQQAIPDHPVIFTKALSSLIGPGDDDCVSPRHHRHQRLRGRARASSSAAEGVGIAAADAWDHVFGYTIVNDLTVRELQRRHVQFFIGKSAVTYCPMGPAIVTRDEVADVTRCGCAPSQRRGAPGRARVRPDLRHPDADRDDLRLGAAGAGGRHRHRYPGRAWASGSTPPRYLQPGDVVEVSIDGLGTLTNTCA